MRKIFNKNSNFFYASRALYSSYPQVRETPGPLPNLTSRRPHTRTVPLFLTGVLYIVNNFLTLKNLVIFEPATYKVGKLEPHPSAPLSHTHTHTPLVFKVAINIKIVITGGLTQLLLGQKLSSTQWMALVLLAIGCRYRPLEPEPPPLNPRSDSHAV